MPDRTKPVRVGIEGISYSLTHVPDLVRYGSKPLRELRAQPALRPQLAKHLRDFRAATAYAPHQVYIGNIGPEQLSDLATPWYENLIDGATGEGRFGDLVDQDKFYTQLGCADRFELVMFDEKWFRDCAARHSTARVPRLGSSAEIETRCTKGALPLYSAEKLIGAFEQGHDEDANLVAEVLLENLATKVTAAHSLRSVLKAVKINPGEIEYVISCSEEAVGDRYNRGGGNLAKAIAEDVGCENASGSDTKAFCAGPMYAMVHGASLIQAGIAKKVAVVAGGSLAKLGMKFESHLKKNMPVLEDVLGSFAAILTAAKPGQPSVRLDSVAFHPVRAGASPQAMAESLAERPLARLGLTLTDVDRYAVELHNPEITVPSGSGDVPRTNYLTLAALAVMRGQIAKSQMQDFVRARGMLGYAPTQGHIPSAIVYLGHAMESLRAGKIRQALLIAKGSLFLGRMTQLSDGCSFLVDRNDV
ncbi:MAG TPA: glycine/sarcosine/betaine reductase complex component C subunit beta [Candidatus Binatia bacterium]|jgi:glycine/sarcosine/betaine reductase complex component C subunit beta|nr:glycine/sarcosine/betaine reductase complex component C subunit beta [Candidatus Binatia bacterium]